MAPLIPPLRLRSSLLRPSPRLRPSLLLRPCPRRTFLSHLLPSSPSPPPQTLTASLTLPFPSAPIYSIIADVPSYASFVPYCTRSTITHWSLPDSTTGRRWPSLGLLTTGFAGVSETLASRVYCVPGRIVESVGGDAETKLPPAAIQHHLDAQGVGREASEGLMRFLRNTWRVEDLGKAGTRIELSVEFAFRNPVYAALSAGVAPKVAEVMVSAFEERVRSVLEAEPGMVAARLEDMEGSRLRSA